MRKLLRRDDVGASLIAGDDRRSWQRELNLARGYDGRFVTEYITTGRPRMPEPLDSRLRDDQALDEIELTSRLMIAASAREGHLSQREVDELLGVAQAG